MGRAPCCDKVGLKKGPWTSQEDQILTSFIENYGHSNWRALPKQAGLLRCGKSCRLRWINYLRPNIKRGNFTKEEEDSIIQLHDMMGNRWSAIAAKLPGRTDNEIKNVWHTYLKKRLNKQHIQPTSHAKVTKKNYDNTNNNELTTSHNATSSNIFYDQAPNTSLQSYSSDEFSSVTDVSSVEAPNKVSVDMDLQKYDANKQFEFDECPIIDDETFWSSQEVSYDDICMDFVFPDIIEEAKTSEASQNHSSMYIANDQANNIQGDDLDFWLDVFVRASEATKLPEF